jgi:putative phosphoribosyl transferase
VSRVEDRVRPVEIPAGGVRVAGDLGVPEGARGVVVFAHGTGSGRWSPRNRFVAEALRRRGLATLLLDLLTEEEERVDLATARLRFDVELLAGRLLAAVEEAARHPETAGLPIGLFGASTGAAAALVAAARRPDRVACVVSRGGRPDLAAAVLGAVRAPTLLIVGGRDALVLELNRAALPMLGGPARLEVVPGASHLFEEPGALERVAELAGDFFVRHLGGAGDGPGLSGPGASTPRP